MSSSEGKTLAHISDITNICSQLKTHLPVKAKILFSCRRFNFKHFIEERAPPLCPKQRIHDLPRFDSE